MAAGPSIRRVRKVGSSSFKETTRPWGTYPDFDVYPERYVMLAGAVTTRVSTPRFSMSAFTVDRRLRYSSRGNASFDFGIDIGFSSVVGVGPGSGPVAAR